MSPFLEINSRYFIMVNSVQEVIDFKSDTFTSASYFPMFFHTQKVIEKTFAGKNYKLRWRTLKNTYGKAYSFWQENFFIKHCYQILIRISKNSIMSNVLPDIFYFSCSFDCYFIIFNFSGLIALIC